MIKKKYSTLGIYVNLWGSVLVIKKAANYDIINNWTWIHSSTHCVCQGIWVKRIIDKLGMKQDKYLTTLCDNNSTIKLSKNQVMHESSKHIDIRFHFLRNHKCGTDVMCILTSIIQHIPNNFLNFRNNSN